LGTSKIQYADGEDGIQALLLAIESIRTMLSKSEKRFSWIGGEPGDTGFVRFIPTFFGPSFSKRLEAIIDREVERFARRLERKYRRRVPRR
jgi:hypothetical protein